MAQSTSILKLRPQKHGIAFYSSKNLKQWEYNSFFEGLYECPDIFELSIEGNTGKTKWILIGAASNYYIGKFDGKSFAAESGPFRLNNGNALYAAQTFSNMPEHDKRTILMAWAMIETSDAPFHNAMTFPVELNLRNTQQGLRLCCFPIREIEFLRTKTRRYNNLELHDSYIFHEISSDLFEIEMTVQVRGANATAISHFIVNGLDIMYDANRQELRCADRLDIVNLEPNGLLNIRILADKSLTEIFCDNGQNYMSIPYVKTKTSTKFKIINLDHNDHKIPLTIKSLQIHEMKSYRQ